MKFKGNLIGALISLAIFLGCAIAGGICLAAGIGDMAQNPEIISSVESVFESIGDFDIDLGVNLTTETEDAAAHYARELSDDIDTIAISTSCCSIDISRGEAFSVDFSGTVGLGSFSVTNENSVAEDGAVLDAAYYDHDGIINASLKGSSLEIGVKAATQVFGINNRVGHITVTIPESYTGSIELSDSIAEVRISGVDINELILKSCLGEADIDNSSIQMLTAANLLGELDTDNCSIYGVDFSNIAGEISVVTDAAFTQDSVITDVMGEVSIDLPVGAQLNIARNDIMGEVSIDRQITGDANAPALDISDVMGEVAIGLDAD